MKFRESLQLLHVDGLENHGVAGHFDEPRDVREWLARLIDDHAAAR